MGDIVLSEGLNELNVSLVPLPPPVAQLSGIVTDAETGQPISGVKVTLGGMVKYTNASGAYLFTDLEIGTYTITFEKEGYETA